MASTVLMYLCLAEDHAVSCLYAVATSRKLVELHKSPYWASCVCSLETCDREHQMLRQAHVYKGKMHM